MADRREKKFAVVTGASQGIGAAIAGALLGEEFDVFLVGRSAEKLRQSLQGNDADASRTILVEGDIGEQSDVARIIEQVCAQCPQLHVLVNCAGAYDSGPWEAMSEARFSELFNVNVRGVSALTRGLLPKLIAAQGDIVFMNSSVVESPGRNAGQYAVTKHALRGLANSLRSEVNEDGVRVLSVYPGRTATPMQESIFREAGEAYAGPELLQPSDIAAMVLAAIRLPGTAEVTDLHIRPKVNHQSGS